MENLNKLNHEEIQKLIGLVTENVLKCYEIKEMETEYGSKAAARDATKALPVWREIKRKLIFMTDKYSID